jgi:cytochrome c2
MPGARLFFALCLLFALLLAGGALFAALTQPTVEQPPVVVDGFGIWRETGCAGCHTLYGQGGEFASDLTRIYFQRGETYLSEYMIDPGAFHQGQRMMPRFGLTVEETEKLVAFLRWMSEQDNARWMPDPVVTHGSLVTAFAPPEEDLPIDPAARGRYWLTRPPASCATCHSLEPDVVIVGPSLSGVASRAETRVPGQGAETYLRNSILHPGDYLVPGFENVMAQNLGEVLTADQINDLLVFLLTLR